MVNKQFKNLDEQVEILRYKGLVINDEQYAKDVLLRENYFFLNGYRHLFMKDASDRNYLDGTTFEELYSLFLFDRQFRNILFKHLLLIENNMKSIISYQLSKKYGYKEKDYLKAKNFSSKPEKQRQVNDLIKKMKRQIRVNGRQHTATAHYIVNYGYIPLWILVKVLSFGIVAELYTIFKHEDQQAIASLYNLEPDVLGNYLSILSNYRNLCAHEDIVYENKTQKFIDDTIYHALLDIKKEEGEYVCGKNDLFALIIILKQMLQDDEFNDMTIEIDRVLTNLEYNLKTISLDKVLARMGFPENWKELASFSRKRDEE